MKLKHYTHLKMSRRLFYEITETIKRGLERKVKIIFIPTQLRKTELKL